MSQESQEHGEVYKHYLELSKPTKEDFERVFTEEELKELCLKHKCRVDIYRWNVVNDYRTRFIETGRFERWSERERLGMLAKAVNRMKPSVLYDDDEIKNTRREEWEFRLKDDILSLNFWHRKQSNNIRQEEIESSDINPEEDLAEELLVQSENVPTIPEELYQAVQYEIEAQTESMDINELLTQTESQAAEQLDEQHEVRWQIVESTESENTEELIACLEANEKNAESQLAQSEEENILLVDIDEEHYFEQDSNDSVDTVLINNQPKMLPETLHSEEIDPEIENVYGINTMTMTIDSQMSTQTQSQDLPLMQSEVVIPATYDNFKNIIPLTSTQSQSQGIEEEIKS